MMTKSEAERFDVVIFRRDTKKVEAVAGANLPLCEGHYNAEKRLETALLRVNEFYDAAIVPAGSYLKGSSLPESAEGG